MFSVALIRGFDGLKEIIASRSRGRTRLMMGLPRVFGRDWAQRILKVFADSIAVKRSLVMIVMGGEEEGNSPCSYRSDHLECLLAHGILWVDLRKSTFRCVVIDRCERRWIFANRCVRRLR